MMLEEARLSYCKPSGAFTPGTPKAKRRMTRLEARFPAGLSR